MVSNKFSHFKTINKIQRKNNLSLERSNYFRLDKNERIIKFENFFMKIIKKQLNSNQLTTYPNLSNVYKLLSHRLKVKENNLILTGGSDLSIKNCFELLVKKDSQVVTLNPTYGMVNVYCKLFLAKQIKINCEKDLTFNHKKICKHINKKTSLIIIANPNSPTGKILEKKEILVILKKAKINNSYVLIDECYHDYCKETTLPLIKKFKNLIVCRSFSKIGLAGCRIGCLVTNKKLRGQLYKFRPFYELTSFSVLVLDNFLKNKTLINSYVNETKKGKLVIEKYFKNKKGITIFHTYTNFILFSLKNKNTLNKLHKILYKKKFLVNKEKNIPHYKNLIKFTLGPETLMRKFIREVDKVIR